MRNLVGLEMVCFCKSTHFTLEYAGGQYVGPKGEPLDDVVDMTCYMCATSFYTRDGDAIPYCPNCGHIDRKRFSKRQELLDYLMGMDFTWLKKNGLTAVTVETWESDWQLKFVARPEQLDGSGQYKSVRKL